MHSAAPTHRERTRRAAAAVFWMLAYGICVGVLWYGALLIGVAR